MKSRTVPHRILWICLGLLVALDITRSLYARIGYEQPTELWQPAPHIYADLTWPPGADIPPDTPTGERIYRHRCAVCHGPDGRGNGPAAPSLIPRPRDFSQGQFKYKSTPPGQPPTDADLIHTVTHGLKSSAMPYWSDLLTEKEIKEVVSFIKGLSKISNHPPPGTLRITPKVPLHSESVERGRSLYTRHGCVACHGPKGRGGLSLKDAKGYPVISRDLTAPWTFRGGREPEHIWLRISTGLAPSPMPAYDKTLTSEERWDLVNYVLSLARIPPWEPGGSLDGPGQHSDPVARGRYLVHAEMCGLCHTQINRTGIYRGDDYYLAGGMRVDVYPHGKYVSRNLTSDPETGLGNWSVEEIVEALQNGNARGRPLNPLDMPWHWLYAYPKEDAIAIASYLKTLPPVRNSIPPPLHYGVLETIAVKLTRSAPAFPPKVLVFVEGNFGETGHSDTRVYVQESLVFLQWIVLVIGAISFLLVRLAKRGGHTNPRAVVFTLIELLAAGAFAVGISVLYQLPALSGLPPANVAKSVLEQVPQPNPMALHSPEQAAMVKRGRLIYTVASCGLCHHPDGSGGLKISLKALGTLWTRNITADKETAIGSWKDREISRAIRSGVTPDGRMLHWQGMIWDHASNWSEEDLRAVIAYLRTLPPVKKSIPPARPPSPDDCDHYTFWISESLVPGCGDS